MSEFHTPDATLTPDVLEKLPIDSVAIQKILPIDIRFFSSTGSLSWSARSVWLPSRM